MAQEITQPPLTYSATSGWKLYHLSFREYFKNSIRNFTILENWLIGRKEKQLCGESRAESSYSNSSKLMIGSSYVESRKAPCTGSMVPRRISKIGIPKMAEHA